MADAAAVRQRTMPASYVVAARYAGLALAAVALAAIHVRRPTTVCLLRATTGIPCPFCGGTTALVRLGRADPVGAVRVSPLAVAMLTSLPLVGRFRRPAWWASPLLRRSAIVATLVVSEVWQLLRLGVIRL